MASLGKPNSDKRARLSPLVTFLFKNSQAFLQADQSLRREVLTLVDRPEITQRIAHSHPISDPFRNPDSELRDSRRLGKIDFPSEGIGKRHQRG